MAPEPRLKLRLLHGWKAVENPQGPATYCREASANSGALQFSFTQYRSGALPNAAEDQLTGICRNLAAKMRGGKIISSRSGACDFGIYGTVVARGDEPAYFQAWVISNRRDFVLVTHTCTVEPDPLEIQEANEIALMTRIG